MKHYNGYKFGPNSVINPYSFTRSVREKQFVYAWNNSADSGTLARTIGDAARVNLLKFIPSLLLDEEVGCGTLNPRVNYYDQNWGLDSAMHFLVLAGYLTYDHSTQKVKIPNLEVRGAWLQELAIVLGNEKMFDSESQQPFRKILGSDTFDASALHSHLSEFMLTFSFHDVTQESVYHAIMASSLATAFPKENPAKVRIHSNLESGHGRFDIAVHFTKAEKVFIFELKKAPTEDKLEDIAKGALEQIEEKKYDHFFSDCKRKIFIGIAFHVKKVSNLQYLELMR
jgi:hypothetical protein